MVESLVEFIDCESVSISYNIMGIATINYVIISKTDSPTISNSFAAGGQSFSGVIMSFVTQPIQKSENSDSGSWYTTNVTLVATTG